MALPQVLQTSSGLRALYGLDRIGIYQDGAWAYPLSDVLGSVRQWTDAQGTVLGLPGYGPYGEPVVPVGPALASWGYTGEWEDASGLVYLRARWYNPTWGRFTQVDPLPGYLEAPTGQHPYTYAAGNPLRYRDPSGEIDPLDVAFLALDAVSLVSDVNAIRREGWTTANRVNLAIDVGATLLDLALLAVPGVGGGGRLAGQALRPALAVAHGGEVAVGAARVTARTGQYGLHIVQGAAHAGVGLRMLAAAGTAGTTEGQSHGTSECRPDQREELHHSIPRQVLGKLEEINREVADAVRGRKGQPNRWPVPRGEHQRAHRGGYNREFMERIKELLRLDIEVTPEVIWRIRDEVAEQFGLLGYRP